MIRVRARRADWSEAIVGTDDGRTLRLAEMRMYPATAQDVDAALADGWVSEPDETTGQRVADTMRHEGTIRAWAPRPALIDAIHGLYPAARHAAVMVRRGDGTVTDIFRGDTDWTDAAEMIRLGPDLADHTGSMEQRR